VKLSPVEISTYLQVSDKSEELTRSRNQWIGKPGKRGCYPGTFLPFYALRQIAVHYCPQANLLPCECSVRRFAIASGFKRMLQYPHGTLPYSPILPRAVTHSPQLRVALSFRTIESDATTRMITWRALI
jgi:hypothetical protein